MTYGNASVGVGLDGSQVENVTNMIYWMYNPNTDSFLSFENGLKVDDFGGSVDVIKLMNSVIGPRKSVSPLNKIDPIGIKPFNISPTGERIKANANPIGWKRSGGKLIRRYNIIPNNNKIN